MSELSDKLIAWYDANRRTLPWREDPTPYHVWVSEIMLQQTRVEAVKGYYSRFLSSFPDVCSLASADEEVLLKLWQGLGYYSRARNLQKAAKQLVQENGGRLPDTTEELQHLPGIGAYTAGAIASIAFGKPVIAPDGNAYRIFARLLQEEGFIEDRDTKERLEAEMRLMLDIHRPGAFNQALMDLGSLICIAKGRLLCAECPLRGFCALAGREDAAQYPKRRPKRKRRIEKKTVLLLQKKDRLLLHKQPETGLLAGLWLFPMVEGHLRPEEVSACLMRYGIPQETIQEICAMDPATHVFSHLEWHMIGYHVTLRRTKKLTREEQEVLFVDADGVREIQDGMTDVANAVWADPDEIATRYAIPAAHRPFFVEW